MKELHYFDEEPKTPLILHLGRRSMSGIQAARALRHIRRAPLWSLRYLFQFRTPQSYRALFQPSAGQICGETTPAYARQPEPVIARVKSTVHNAKIIYILRDPVERIWSQVRMDSMNTVSARNSRDKKNFPSEQKMLDILQQNWEKMAKNSDYFGNLTRWQRYFPAEDIFVGFFEQLERNPKQFLRSILQFLNVRSDDAAIPPNVDVARNQRPGYTMPPATRRMITERLFPQIESIHAYLDNPFTARWLQNSQATLREK